MLRINYRGKLFIAEKPVVMGIINVTPDSFYAGSRTGLNELVAKAGRMLEEGAAMLDIGGQSTRPGSSTISAEEEIQRVVPAIQTLYTHFPDALLSIDTYYASVAKAAFEAGAGIINDISAGLMDEAMLPTVAALGAPYIAMHMKGTPATMQQQPEYNNIGQEVLDYFIERIHACRSAGIKDIILDPGFGFGKTTAHNFELLRKMELLHIPGLPLLAGVSRKGMIWRTLGITAEEALNGTTVLHTVALMKGAAILRVHDVKEAVECVRLVGDIKPHPTPSPWGEGQAQHVMLGGQ
ncbi:dihydropteroate synthase [Parasegetibacter sp. NRK P23]|uniref:dihydropteroate synthase n=1 Tax=Parasegetibacter sp. NRK P23 TaxID=2942999 RepID=UPI0020444061|nr:dihydropteroate synthase [Parasegetibacter sp. NRK P23]MCM5528268.1 dihydropteroate synthase [Parasegetibacter sp. NRK P23]